MKLIGWVLIAVQILSLISPIVKGENIFNGTIPYIIGRFSFGVIGIILVLKGKKREHKMNVDKMEDKQEE